ncbi:cytochrome c oxidase subunit 3 [Sphingobium sp. DEHP117]|uniref:cytochrome c oxidase subunit 3 n=1 Tax=Sphingobium sp. DEHP117 TaxID=2993436 RepID=UPI0027D672DF|nr:cytochrome c oxidase subunit 3 [Sphingobium sp. DEHP117]MDQ4420369.1 cytochrome c oxidase subunit 3 [Sphingobium sp. DEHP117]
MFRTKTKVGRLPAEPGWWAFVAGDLVMFGILFATFVYYRALSPQVYERAQTQLSTPLGLLNTLLLLTGSLFVAQAVSAFKHKSDRSFMLFVAGLGTGVAFVGVKVVEWGSKLAHGITPLTNEFFMFYFTFTGIHLVHVVVGMGMLLVIALKAKGGVFADEDRVFVEIGGIFWHLVDLIWIVLFPLIYLTR